MPNEVEKLQQEIARLHTIVKINQKSYAMLGVIVAEQRETIRRLRQEVVSDAWVPVEVPEWSREVEDTVVERSSA